MRGAATTPPSDRYFVSDGLSIHYAEWGSPGDETLVLLHGNRDQCRSWDFFITALFDQGCPFSHMVAVDLRGHGDSDWLHPGRAYQYEDFLKDLTGLLRHFEKNSATLIAHSLGGSIAMLFAGSLPAKVKKLVLIESAGPFARSEGDVPKLLAQWLEGEASSTEVPFYATQNDAAIAIKKKFPLIPDEVCAHMARHGTKATGQGYVWKYDPRLRLRSYSVLSEGQTRAFIQRIECPTLLIYGSEGDFLKSPRASRIGLFKSSRLIEITGSGHHVPHEKPNELAEVVYPFLRETFGR